jgi:putative transposase
VRKTYQDKLQPPAEHAGALEVGRRRCRALYTAGLQERRDAWQNCGVRSTAASQSVQLPPSKDVRPPYRDGQSQVLQDVLPRLDRACEAFFRRVQAGDTPGYPRCHAATRYHSFTDTQFGNGATLDHGSLVLSQVGRLAVRWSRPLQGSPKTVTISQETAGG